MQGGVGWLRKHMGCDEGVVLICRLDIDRVEDVVRAEGHLRVNRSTKFLK